MVALFHVRDGGGLDCRRNSRLGDINAFRCALKIELRGFGAYLVGSHCKKKSACNAGDPGLITGSGRSPGEGNGYPLQYFCLENPMDRGAWQATAHGVAKN